MTNTPNQPMHWPRALTMRPPWGTAIIHLGKSIENRTWCTSYRGPIYLHQGHTWSEQGVHDPRVLTAWAKRTGHDDLEALPQTLPTGAIIGRAMLTDCHKIDRRDTCCGVWADRLHDDLEGHPLRYRVAHWVLDDVQALPEPIPTKGGQGLWSLDISTADTVDAILADAAHRCPPRPSDVVTLERLERLLVKMTDPHEISTTDRMIGMLMTRIATSEA